MKYNSFKPGEVWLDTSGNRIQAHGGSVIFIDGVYYFYGENKEKTDGKNGIWHWGVRCYSSDDLYNWTDLGLIIPPDLEDENSPLHPTAKMDRPHIIYNKETKKFVCWLKVMTDNGQKSTVLVADKITGPYAIVKTGIKNFGMSSGDFDLVIAPDGKGYYYFERAHKEIICADLSDDYTEVTGYYSTHFPMPHPPYVREAPAHFTYNNKQYLITSGTTGYYPNPSEVAVANTYHGPFKVLGNPHENDKTRTSFHSQISSVFKVPGKKKLYIACADRWLPDYMSLPYDEYAELFAMIYDSEGRSEERMEELRKKYFGTVVENTSVANYVWLPLRFEEPSAKHPDGMVYIDWLDEWRIEDFD